MATLHGFAWLCHKKILSSHSFTESVAFPKNYGWPKWHLGQAVCHCGVFAMGNLNGGLRSKTHIALLGDSTIDNGRWVPRGEPSVFDQEGTFQKVCNSMQVLCFILNV